MTATAATPLTVRDGFLMRYGSRRSLSSGLTFASMDEFGGTVTKPYFLQSFSFRFWSDSLSDIRPDFTESIISRES